MPRPLTNFLALLALLIAWASSPGQAPTPSDRLFGRDNLVAWCIVPFDSKKRGPEERAAMLERLGFRHFAYDWREEHVPTFDAEIEALKRHGVALDAFWLAPGTLNPQSRMILDLLKRHGVKAQLWVLLDLGGDIRVSDDETRKRVERAAGQLKPLAEAAAKAGCSLALYNHGGWFGEPENQVRIIEELKKSGVENVGIVYNLHHGQEQVNRLPSLLRLMMPYLKTVNLDGVDAPGDPGPRKILPLGQGAMDLDLLRQIRDSGYRGPIGILGHTQDDAEARLRDNLDGLDWLVPQLDGKAPGPKPTPRTPVVPPPKRAEVEAAPDARAVAALLSEARERGDARRGAMVFGSAKHACISCHKVAGIGGEVGPDLGSSGLCLKPEEVVESILWPRLKVKEGYEAVAVATVNGRVRQGYRRGESASELTLSDPATLEALKIPRDQIEAVREVGSLMPEGQLAAMTAEERRDLVRFLIELGKPGSEASTSALRDAHAHAPAEFTYDRKPIDPARWPGWQLPVNRDRVYDFYAKEAEHFARMADRPGLLPPYPGLDGGKLGHWGNQNEDTWSDDRWNAADVGVLLSGVFRGAGVTVPKGVCVRIGDRGEVSACFDPETLTYPAAWSGGFVKFSSKRHGFLDGLILDGTPLPRPEGSKPAEPFTYRGFYRHGNRVVFAYRVGAVEMLDAPWVEDGKFVRVVAPADRHPLRHLTQGGPSRWPEIIETRGTRGEGQPYAVDTIAPPFGNRWKSLMFFGDHDFLPDGSALLCTMQGDVWHASGLDDTLEHVRWRRFASGLHQALGLVVAGGEAYVLGRDQITRLRDLDGDGEADFHECVSNAYVTSTAGHDFICGLQRDPLGNFYTVSGKQGLIKIHPDGRTVETIATGFRNPDGLGLAPDGTLTVPSSEGDWVPSSMVALVRPGGHYGYGGPRGGAPPDLPLVYLPRGVNNSSGGQVCVESPKLGALDKQWVHLSFGAGAAFLLLADSVDGQPQGLATPIAGEFASGVHRGRVNPKDGWLYASGMSGWGSYTPLDGCFQRIRYTGGPGRLPVAWKASENGVLLTFSDPIDPAVAADPAAHLAQAWNYRYGPGYGSQELSPSHAGIPGHDLVAIRSAHVLADGRSLFLEMPEIRPVNQLHMHVRIDSGPAVDLYATVHRLAAPFTGFAGYRPDARTIPSHPILADMAALTVKPTPNPWSRGIPGARSIRVEAGKNLSFLPRTINAKAGEPIKLSFVNPDVVPHNWALARPGTLSSVGDLANKLVAEPDAVFRQYIPRSPDVLVYTDIAEPQGQSVISFRAPDRPGRYPFLCTFPGHWMVMNGELIVE